jgi:hypothetical protein
MHIKLLRIAQAGFVLGMTSLMVVASASADGVPTIMPANPNSLPAHTQINRAFSLLLALFVLALMAIIIQCIWKIINTLRDGAGIAGGASAALVISLIVLGLTVSQGTGYLTGWTGYFA